MTPGAATPLLDERTDWSAWYRSEPEGGEPLALPAAGGAWPLPYRLLVPPTREPVRFALVEEPFRLDAELRALTAPLAARTPAGGETNARLRGVRRTSDGVTLVVQPADYAAALRTNFAMDAPLPGGGTVRGRVHAGGRLGPVEASRLADHLGVNALVLAADDALVLRRRSARAAFRPGALAPSSSGAVALADAAAARDARTLLRETEEELGVRAEDVRAVEFLGLARELVRGGKPELFLLVRTALGRGELARRAAGAQDRGEWAGPLRVVEPDARELATLIAPAERSSAPLLAALALLHRYHAGLR